MASALASALDATPSRAPIPAGDEQGERQVTRLTSDVNTCMPGKSDSETSIHKSQRLENSSGVFFFGIGYSQNFTHFLVVSSSGAAEII